MTKEEKTNEELELLKAELENVIDGMTICEELLTPEEWGHLKLHKRCLVILKKIRPAKE